MRLRALSGRTAVDHTATMTDISYLLIIFLVLCAAFAAGLGLRLRLPEKDESPNVLPPAEVIVVALAADGSATVEERVAADRAAALSVAIHAKPGAVVAIDIAGELRYRVVLDVLAEARDAGAQRFSLKTAPRSPVPVKVEGQDAD